MMQRKRAPNALHNFMDVTIALNHVIKLLSAKRHEQPQLLDLHVKLFESIQARTLTTAEPEMWEGFFEVSMDVS